MTPCTAAAEQKADFLIETESYFLHFKVIGFENRRDHTTNAFGYGDIGRLPF